LGAWPPVIAAVAVEGDIVVVADIVVAASKHPLAVVVAEWLAE